MIQKMKFLYWNIPVFQVESHLEVKRYLSDFHNPKRQNSTSFYVEVSREVCIGYQIFNREHIGQCCWITNHPKKQWFKTTTFLISHKISMDQLGGSRNLGCWALLVSTELTTCQLVDWPGASWSRMISVGRTIFLSSIFSRPASFILMAAAGDQEWRWKCASTFQASFLLCVCCFLLLPCC